MTASDALVLFGVTGDLAYRQIFPALQRLVRNAALDVPVNALHAKGFVSIGCAPCTRAIAPGEPERNGRWWWESDGVKECGLHLPRATTSALAVCG